MHNPIGIFDSGVGGLSVLREVRRLIPGADIIYVADQEHVPYGTRPMDQIRDFSHGITTFLIEKGARLIVVACNTASAAALQYLRQEFPLIHFVGMEPAVKPAAEMTRSGAVGVLATPATFQGKLFESVVERFAANIQIHQSTCPGLVQQIEAGELASPETVEILRKALIPMVRAGVDAIVLGCTHYPFVIPSIQKIVGENVRVIDPSPAVAKQVNRLYAEIEKGCTAKEGPVRRATGLMSVYTTGDPSGMNASLKRLLGFELDVQKPSWSNGKLV
jgi:glutamate racemase